MQSIKECCNSVDTKSVGQQAQRVARRFLPVISWAPTLTSKKIIADCTGGFIAGVMIVPTCLSWASLAGLNLSCGLSAALMASLSYGTFGSCAVLSIGPVAEITTLLISISGIPEAKREQTFQSIGVQVGIVSVLLSFIDGGKVIKTIFAKPVGDGYTCAAALLAICVQLKTMFNVKAPAATLIQDVLYQTIKALIQQFSIKCVYSFLLFMTYCLYLIYIKKTKLPLWIPHQLIVVVVSTLVTYNFKLYSEDSLHLGIVGTIPSGLKKPDFPPWENVIGLGPYTLTITIISFVQMYVIAQRVMPDINPNGELFASGVTNFLCNVFGGMPVTNSFSVSSVLLEQHVNTPLTAYAAATVLFITITFLTKLGVFYYLPKQALGAIVVASVWRLVDFSGPMRLWQYSKKDAAVWVVTFVLTIFGGITVGVLGGIGLSLILVVLRVARPRAVAVGFNMSTFHYGDISKDPELLVYPNILLWRFDAPLYFVNAGYFQEKLLKAIQAEVRPIDVVLVTCGKVVDIDAAALGALPTMIDSIAKADKNRPRRIILCDIHGRLEQVLLASEALPMYVPDEYDRLSIDQIEKSGKFPVVFKKLEDAIGFAQRCVSEWYGNVDTAPYPNVSFLTDLVVEAARMQDAGGGSALEAIADHEEARGGAGGEDDDDEGRGPGMAHETAPGALTLSRSAGRGGAHGNSSNNMNVHLLVALEKLKKLSSFSPDRELIGVIGVVRHTEVTPRQKEKILFTERRLIHCVFKNDASLTESKRSPADLEGLFAALEELLQNGRLRHADSWRRVMTVVRSNPPGLKIKVKAQPIFSSHEGSFSSLDVRRQQQLEPHTVASVQAARFVVKWGGVPTRSGLAQAHVLGEKLFARFYAAGDLPLRRLLAFTKKPTVFASDDSRVVSTALVVTNALTQSAPVEEEDIILDDVLLKTLSPTAKRLLHDEYKYFEALMHIGSHAAARHYFHIPGFRQLLLIPPLDRPLTMGGDGFGDEEATEDFFDNSNWRPKDAAAKATGASSVPQEGAAGVGYRGALGGTGIGSHSLDPLGDHVTANGRTDISFFHGPRALGNRAAFVGGGGVGRRQQQQRSTLANSDYYTPFEVMQELEKNLRVVVEMKLPHHILSLPLSNHETLRELRQRYGTMLRVFLGAKQRQKMSTREAVARRGQEGSPGSSVGQPSPRRKQRLNASDSEEDEDGNDDEEEEEGGEYGSSMDPGAPSSVALHTDVTKDGGEHEEEEEELEVVGGSSEGEEGDAAEEEGTSDNSSEAGGDAVMAEIMSTQREQEGITGPATDVDVSPTVKGEHEDKEKDASPALEANLVHEESTGVFAASHTTQPYSSAINAARVSAQQLSTTAVSHTTEAVSRTRKATLAGKGSKHETKSYLSGSTPYSPKTPSAPPNFAPHPRLDARGPSTSPPGASSGSSGSKRYDLSDISKLRDHGSYDLSYNVAILKSFHAATRMPEMRRLMDALARIARITECMSRVGENVLEGVNSSKRFIIGSLVSGGLLESIYYDYKDFAKMDERKGVKELLYRAQALYMAERGGVEQDVQHVVKLFRRFGKRRKTAGDAAVFEPLRGDEPYRDETPAEREFRLKFPFISLPKEDPLTCSSRGAAQQRGGGRPSAKVQKSNKARARPTGPTAESNGEDDGCSATRFYFTTYLHVEGALQCLFESVMVEGFSRPSKEELEESQQLYMKHLIFKVFRRRNYSFTDAEALAAFRKLHLLFRSEVDYGRQQRELRAALANTYHSMYYLSMEVYLSLGDSEGVGGAEPLVGPLMYLDSSDACAGGGGDDMWMSTEDQRLGGGGRRSSQSASGIEEEDDDEDGDISEADLAHTAPGEQQPHQTLSFASTNARSTSPRGRFTSTPGAVSASYDALSGGGSGHSPRSPSFASGRQPPLTNSTFAESTLVRLNANVAAASDAAVAMSSAVVSSLRGASPVSFAEGDGGAVSVAVSAEPSLVALQQPPAKKARKAHHANKKAATVLTTPQAGRGAAAVQEMKNRVSSVTPMRRIHEGMSLDDFLRLIKEAESAILSQETDD